MATVKFHLADEFLQELEADRDLVDRSIVRITGLFRRAKDLPVFRVYLIATAKLINGDIVKLEGVCQTALGKQR